MKNLYMLSAGLLVAGVLGAAACSGCPPPEEDSGGGYQPSQVTCGPNTHREGNQCVGNAGRSGGTSSTNTRQKTTLKSTGD